MKHKFRLDYSLYVMALAIAAFVIAQAYFVEQAEGESWPIESRPQPA